METTGARLKDSVKLVFVFEFVVVTKDKRIEYIL